MTFTHRAGTGDATDATSYAKTVTTMAGGGVLWVTVHSNTGGVVPNVPALTMTGATFTQARTAVIGTASRLSVFYSQDYDAGSSVALTIDFGGQTQVGMLWSVEEQTPGRTSGDPLIQAVTGTPMAQPTTATLSAGTGGEMFVVGRCDLNASGAPATGTELFDQNISSPTIGLVTYWDPVVQTTPTYTWAPAFVQGTLMAFEIAVAAVPVEPEPEPEPPPVVDTEGCETLEYRAADGETVRFLTLAGVTGRFMPPIGVTSIPVPAGHGSRFRGAAHIERPVVTPVAAPGIFDDRAELRRWARVLDPAKGEGTLAVVGGEWAGRQLRCVYEAGLDEMEESSRSPLPATLIWRAAYPYWEDGVESSETVTQSATPEEWFPFFPLVLGPSDTFDSFSMTNQGDVTAWPVVTVTGPSTDVELSNTTTGQLWHVTGVLAAGATLTVDTRPGFKTVDVDGVNRFGWLTPESALWGLAPGENEVVVAGALTTSATSVRFAWRQAWLSA